MFKDIQGTKEFNKILGGLMKSKDEKELKLLFWVSLDDEGRIREQGQVVSDFIYEGYFLSDIFSWIDGSYMYTQLRAISFLTRCNMFTTSEELGEWVRIYKKKRGEE